MSEETYEKLRIARISDCVFAIAMTLLVFDLKMPVLEAPISSQAFAQALLGHLPNFTSWMLSFVVLARFWFLHHGLIAREETRPGNFVAVNFVFLAAVALTPFSSSLRVQYSDQFLSVVVYSATFLAAALALWALSALDHGRRGVWTIRYQIGRSSAIWAIAIAVAACLIAVKSPPVGALLWLLFPFVGQWERYRRERANARSSDNDPG